MAFETIVTTNICRPTVMEHNVKPKDNLQRCLYTVLDKACPPFSLFELLSKRYKSWLEREDQPVAPALAKEAVDFFEDVVRQVPPAMRMILLKTLLDGWTTSNNFGLGYKDCSFCKAACEDNCLHFAVCPELRSAYQDFTALQPLPSLHWLFLPPIGDESAKLRVVAHIVATYHCFNICKNGTGFNRRMYRSFIDKAMRDSRIIRQSLIVA